jgi:hypothetical protein
MANPPSSNQVAISFDVSKVEAEDFAELVKRLSRRDLGPNDLNLVTHDEEPEADAALLALRVCWPRRDFCRARPLELCGRLCGEKVLNLGRLDIHVNRR